ncbi:LysR family transcriptional regulator [Phytohabitans kaempferiae]|uniref:LysR family transcriptional regulator n=1 Tax=Phytohabitans kaempferiae TaxID=1620943 RepID=A0ABV6MGW7_9ACTN
MDLRLLKYFLATVDHGSVTRAAEALYITQPSLSQAIRTLELDLGVKLFDRSSRGVTLTAEGSAFTAPARQLLADVHRARRTAQEVGELRRGRLDLSVQSTLALEPLPHLTNAFSHHHPDVLIVVRNPGGAAGVEQDLRKGRAELGITDMSETPEGLARRTYRTQETVIVLPPDLAQDLPDPVPHALVAAIPLIVELSNDRNRILVDKPLEALIGNVAIECAHRQAVWELVMRGAGATFLPRDFAEAALRRVVVRSLEPKIVREVSFVFRPGLLSPAAQAFLSLANLGSGGRSGGPPR